MRLFNAIIFAALGALSIYLAFAFANAGFDITEWDEKARKACAFFGFFAALIAPIMGEAIANAD